MSKLKKGYFRVIRKLAKLIDCNDKSTYGHCDKVTKYAVTICKKLKLARNDVEKIKIAALLHDIGKIGAGLNVTKKEGPLTPDDWAQIRKHPEVGANFVKEAGFLDEIVSVVRHHHAKFEGGGYPDAEIKGKGIPIGARIIAVADAFDAMTSNRPYRKAMTRDEAIAELERCSGAQFDPEIVDAFIS